ncbi:MAG: 3-oxoacyl-ACP reductase family protein [Saprospiraceae bacterium]
MIDFITQLFDLTGKTALIAGGTKGLGKNIAQCLCKAGAKVAICSRNEEEAQAIANSLTSKGKSSTMGVKADISYSDDVKIMVKKVEKELGSIDILVNCAGINIRRNAIALKEEEWDEVLNTNLKGAFLLAKEVLPSMYKNKWGRIVFLGSVQSFVSIPGRVAYASSKAGLLGLTRTLALESAPYQVCVNTVCPGPFRTPMNEIIAADPEKYQKFVSRVPMKRWGEPQELEGLILYLCSPSSSFMTGSALTIDGGWTAQ